MHLADTNRLETRDVAECCRGWLGGFRIGKPRTLSNAPITTDLSMIYMGIARVSEELRLKVVSVVVVAREHHLWLDWIYASPKVTKDQKRITLAFSSLI